VPTVRVGVGIRVRVRVVVIGSDASVRVIRRSDAVFRRTLSEYIIRDVLIRMFPEMMYVLYKT